MNFVPMKKILVLTLILVQLEGLAQAPPPPTPPPPPGLPINDGLVFLLITALMFGIYTINKIKKRAI
jgi:hypothetical protein